MTTLYHYCSTTNFFKIMTTKSLRLSMVTLSNDSAEGLWILNAFETYCQYRSVDASVRDRLISLIQLAFGNYACLASCLSKNGDQLSQWRGYGDDAKGFSIGFDVEALRQSAKNLVKHPKPAAQVHEVIYNSERHAQTLTDRFDKILQIYENGGDEYEIRTGDISPLDVRMASPGNSAGLYYELTMLYDVRFQIKNPAFSEEAEWRVAMPVFAKSYAGCKFDVRGSTITPYVDMPIDNWEKAIVSIIRGPSNPTPTDVIEGFVRQQGVRVATVSSSTATYRR